MTDQPSEDAHLVRSTLAGDARSFEEIVRRYQTLVCSIAYSGTGDLALSEDVAQDTFLTAWRTMGQLREPRSLRAWLCGIARRLAANTRRAMSRAAPAVSSAADAPCMDSAHPAERMIDEEDLALMRETLSQLPTSYREPLILFYREERSVRRVAEDLGLSEDAVKQRLSRGRRLLTERVAAYVEQALTQSKPGKTFLVAVMAALPALTPQAAAAGVIAAGGKGTILGKSALFGGAIAALWGPVLGLLGAWVSVRAGVRAAKSPAERRLMIRTGWIVFGYIALLNIFIAAAYALPYIVSMTSTVVILAILSLLYVVGIIRIAVWANRRQRQIRMEDGTEWTPQSEWANLTTRNMTGSLAGATCGGIAWIFSMAVVSGDWLTAVAIAGVACGALLLSLWAVRRRPKRYYHVSIALTASLGVLNLVVVNLRWIHWVEFVVSDATAADSLMPPLWALNLLLIGIFAMVLTALVFRVRHLHARG
jgi:RNA polymerase sigma factor (sigma-70 family)